jgi:CDP-diacylglycerol---glycerol-3-phosphate 3-phosphatidyltransferase
MNLPNRLTVLRILLAPVFVALILSPGLPLHYFWSLLVFAVASITDRLDGKIARERGLITNFGKFLDPLADKILVIFALACFVPLGLANIWCLLIVVAREFMVTFIRLMAVENGVVLAANKWGKTKTVSQIVSIVFILVFQSFFEILTANGTSFILFASGIGSLSETGLIAAVSVAGNVLVWISTFFAVLSGGIYLKQNFSVLRDEK